VSSSYNEAAFSSRYNRSLERSRARREEAGRARRRRIRLRGGGLSAALVALALAVVGAGAAVGQQATGAGSGLLAAGAQGSEVTAIQRALGISASGAFDANTEAAVKQFQQRNGLAVDGIVGPQTKAALGLAPAPATSAPASTGPGTAASGSLESIAQCESGGNPQAIGGGGQYRGKYQFTRESWAAVGGTGDPAAAPEAEQDRRAAMLYAQSGASNWPACGR
jgi:peptidoglycan hydrolase-like protein with peptidoglycan-binding domain